MDKYAFPSIALERWLLPVSVSFLLAGCVSAVHAPTPTVDVPARWQADISQRPQTAVSDAWWRDLGSEELNTLVAQALRANRDLQMASARVAQARALAGVVESDRMPQVSAVAGASRGRQTILDPKTTVVRAGVQASWEADVFGQKGLASRAAELDAEGVELARQGAETIVAAEVATAYLDAAILTKREELGRQRLEVLTLAVDTAQKQFVAGRMTRVDINRQEAAQRAYAAELEQVRSARQQRLLQLAVLLGASPGSVQPTFAEVDSLRMEAPAPWQPGELLERRPDVRRQAKEVDAAAARLGMAKLDLYPKFVFSWANVRERAKVDGQDAATHFALGYGVSLSLPILDGGRIRANIKVNEARLQEAMAAYEKAMLEALANVETVLVQQDAAATSQKELEQAVVAGETAVASSQKLFNAGLADRNNVLESQQTLLQARDALLQAKGANWIAGVDVYRAFAGRANL
ncbi:efflux transporter outer membrane subunit [Uliginosibacterium gangwonense]|uniref:efflux transporter outer membrane subunit n=1 Tax=Uliginosibacterium gangwonense TaxID=392736 RepID=UPI00035D7384|nr:TolC family protein [Uliginosibacterium gangwonense]